MIDTLKMVSEFHEAFDLPVANKPTIPHSSDRVMGELFTFSLQANKMARGLLAASKNDESGMLMYMHLCLEELGELSRALAKRDPVGTLDALADMRYVADGAVLHLGFGDVFSEAMEEVHASNMSKLVDGKPVKNNAGRMFKPDTYYKPNLVHLAYSHMEPA